MDPKHLRDLLVMIVTTCVSFYITMPWIASL
jgi:hypothetical protein